MCVEVAEPASLALSVRPGYPWATANPRSALSSVAQGPIPLVGAPLEKITERLEADAPNMRRLGADLIAHYLDLDRLPVEKRWSRRHADTQRRHVRAVRRPGHWQAGDRLVPAPTVAGESAQWVDPTDIPSSGDVARLGQARPGAGHGGRAETCTS